MKQIESDAVLCARLSKSWSRDKRAAAERIQALHEEINRLGNQIGNLNAQKDKPVKVYDEL
jgi:hypothetical protein